ncbi:hypothetical protein E2C01_030963 [Portunus trituberculatus]|uniref:Uncharacterized protein n=1 Tax=Portunus trituberculatus TaxID=210409 RepID=A0A5B7ET91_PORTR|nr:hypothetical protein [Portunus trituberculatus]
MWKALFSFRPSVVQAVLFKVRKGHRWELESAGPSVFIPLPLLLLLLLLHPDLPAGVEDTLQIDKHALAITQPRPVAPHATHLSPHATMSVRGALKLTRRPVICSPLHVPLH